MDEVKSLHIILNKAAQHFESTTLSNNSRQESQEVLERCQNVLEDLDSLIGKQNSLTSASTSTNKSISQVLQKVRLGDSVVLGAEDIATLRVRLISNTTLLNGFIQRFEILTITIRYIVLMSLHSYDSDEVQARLDNLGLRRTASRDSIISCAGSINTKKACEGLFSSEVQDIFKHQQMVTSNQMDDSTSGNQSQLPEEPPQLPELGNSSDEETSPILIENKPKLQSRFCGLMDYFLRLQVQMLDAAEAGDTQILNSTLEHVWSVNFVDNRVGKLGMTALHKAVLGGHKDIVQLLLSKGASTEVMDSFGNTPLHLATCFGHTTLVELLLTEGASIEARIAMDLCNNTPLNIASREGHTRVVELLLTKGASVEVTNEDKHTPLHTAAQHGHTSVVELLLSKGASIEAINSHNDTPLHTAIRNGHTSTIELLITKGASVGVMGRSNCTPLHLAAEGGHTRIAGLLLSKGASVEAMDYWNHTPLHCAAMGGHSSTVELILSKGASTEVMDDFIGTPLHCAVMGGHTSTVEVLLRKGASIEAMDHENHTPLHLATLYGCTGIVKLLENKAAKLVFPGNI